MNARSWSCGRKATASTSLSSTDRRARAVTPVDPHRGSAAQAVRCRRFVGAGPYPAVRGTITPRNRQTADHPPRDFLNPVGG